MVRELIVLSVSFCIALMLWLCVLKFVELFGGPFATGFWSGFWTRVFMGTLRTKSGSGCLEYLFAISLVLIYLFIKIVLHSPGTH